MKRKVYKKDNKEYWADTIRLKNYDYGSNGTYFVTICTKNNRHYFGNIVENEMKLSELGRWAKKCWDEIPTFHPYVSLDTFVIMPNHIHGLLNVNKPVETRYIVSQKNRTDETRGVASLQYKNKFGSQSQNLASIIRGYKSAVTTYARQNNLDFLWQPKYYDRIVGTESEYLNIQQYIIDNPRMWGKDNYNE